MRGALGFDQHEHRHHEEEALNIDQLSADDRLALLKGMLTNLGLNRPWARLVVLAGHDSDNASNAQSAGLACGAAAGHSGAVNARLAVRLYNDPALRAQLGDLTPPEDSIAVAAIHDTSTDELRILDREAIPASHQADVEALCASAATAVPPAAASAPKAASAFPRPRASQVRRRQPQPPLGGSAPGMGPRRQRRDHRRPPPATAPRGPWRPVLPAQLRRRQRFRRRGAQPRPNRPSGGGELDQPQYYASSVDPKRFGSGDKILHTVVGGVGVSEGADGDIRGGLSLQSVSRDGDDIPEALRLQVYVAAEQAAIDQVIAGHDHLRGLVDNDWISLHQIGADAQISRRHPGGLWKVLD